MEVGAGEPDGIVLLFQQLLGIEPAANVARVAEEKGVRTKIAFFGRNTARNLLEAGTRADLIVANNVLAHVPDLNDFVAALRMLLAEDGVITVEFPHLLKLIEEAQFDTIYHEHFSYFSLLTAMAVFAAHGLCVFDVDEIERALHRGDSEDDVPIPDEFQSLYRHEREYIEFVLSECGGNISQAARRLGLHRQSLQRKLRKYTPNA